MSPLLQLMPLTDAPAHLAWLGDDERTQLAAITHFTRARQFVAGHCLARQLAADWAGGAAPEWRLRVADDGRRGLDHPRLAPLFVSISHGGALLAAAVGGDPLGVDLESAGKQRDWVALARTMFSPAEVEALQACSDADRKSAFLDAWTLKEAWAKRSGRGLQRQSARQCTSVAWPAHGAEAWTWRLPDGGSLALATTSVAKLSIRGVVGEPRAWRYIESLALSGPA